MKKIKFLIMAMCLIVIYSNAQSPGTNCTGSPTLTAGNYNYLTMNTGNTGWYSYTPSAANSTLVLTDITTDTLDRISKIELFDGTCSSPTIITRDTLTSLSDSTLYLNMIGLVPSQTYFIKLTRLSTGNQTAEFRINSAVLPYVCDIGYIYNYTGQTNVDGYCAGFDQTPPPSSVCNLTICCSDNFVLVSGSYNGGSNTWNINPNPLFIDGFMVMPSGGYPSYTVAYTIGTTTTSVNFPYPGGTTYTISPINIGNNICFNLVITTKCSIGDYTLSPSPACIGQQVCLTYTTGVLNSYIQFNPHIPGISSQFCNPDPSVNGGICQMCFTPTTSGTYAPTFTTGYVGFGGPPSCVGVTTLNLVVSPSVGVVSVNPNTPICLGSSVTLSASAVGATSYTWYPGGTTGSTLAVTPTANVTYTVVASSGGCQNSVIYDLQTVACCISGPNVYNLSNVNIVAPGASTLVWSNLVYGGNYSGNIALPYAGYTITGAYNVSGGLTISTPVTFGSSHIAFADAIQVNQNATTVINKSYWHGCNKNWKGIISTKMLTVSNSVIEDAQTAIDAIGTNSAAPHPGVFVDNTIFNINTTGIKLSGVNFSDYRVTGNIFTSRAIPAANYVYTSGSRWTSLSNFSNASLAAYTFGFMKGSAILNITSSERGQMGIWHNYASNLITGSNPTGDLKVGDVSLTPTLNAQYTNVFDNLRIGIISNGSKNIIYNNYFQNISYVGYNNDFSTATACFYNTLNRSKVGSSVNGPAAIPYANYFTNSQNGVYSASNGTLTLSNNQFSLISQYAVWIYNWQQSASNTSTVSITNNTFNSCLYDLYSTLNFSINLNFSNNTSTYPFVSFKPKVTYHAYISELGKPASSVYNIGFNQSTGKVNGVYCIGMYAPSINNNTITVRTPIGSGFNAPIWLDNTDQGSIQSNRLNVSPINNQSFNTFGIFTNVGNNNLYCDNFILGAGSSMKFQGTSPSRIWKNNLNSDPANPCIFGVFLDNYGYVGPIKYNSACAENVFGDFTNGDTYVQNGAIGSLIDVPSPFNPTNPFYTVSNVLGIGSTISFTNNLNNTINQAACTSGQQLMALSAPSSSSGSSTLSSGVPDIMNNSVPGNIATKAIANKSTYEMVRKGKTDVSNIPGGAAFMNTQLNGSAGSFYKVDSLVQLYLVNGSNGTLNQAKALNLSVNAASTPEANQKAFNVIYFEYVKNQGALTNNQINALKTLAALCPFTDGTSVYQARAMVKHYDTTDYFNACEYSQPPISSNRVMNTNTGLNTSKEALSTLVFPNPASTELTVTSDLVGAKLLIFNLVGQLVIESEINSITKINVSELRNGTYIYKVVKDDKIIKADKLIISK